MREDVKRDWRWSDGYLPAVEAILNANAMYLVNFEIASEQEDLTQATDMIIQIRGDATIAVRLRRSSYAYRDLTIRAWRAGGIETELQKIQRGFATFYLYGWTDQHYGIPEWMLVDMDKLRDTGLLEAQRIIHNRDGRTGFIAINHQVLQQHGCILSGNVQAS